MWKCFVDVNVIADVAAKNGETQPEKTIKKNDSNNHNAKSSSPSTAQFKRKIGKTFAIYIYIYVYLSQMAQVGRIKINISDNENM